ncbi:uncharacterized protein B0H18DRAFT_1105188 [Fomitopsis serialis]|uniref:uncharacterized protein n=1 Tax=Fomitopsis serialis TaxID=139415 RepID=UPI002007321D|nr:uncharacterized protein B0H18DRAFT_1105188 [Neoantrodia serialis]KAH9923848.1 hypothetical protein B0H18DRAFT_1105188 [Neoantrodia serialis]
MPAKTIRQSFNLKLIIPKTADGHGIFRGTARSTPAESSIVFAQPQRPRTLRLLGAPTLESPGYTVAPPHPGPGVASPWQSEPTSSDSSDRDHSTEEFGWSSGSGESGDPQVAARSSPEPEEIPHDLAPSHPPSISRRDVAPEPESTVSQSALPAVQAIPHHLAPFPPPRTSRGDVAPTTGWEYYRLSDVPRPDNVRVIRFTARRKRWGTAKGKKQSIKIQFDWLDHDRERWDIPCQRDFGGGVRGPASIKYVVTEFAKHVREYMQTFGFGSSASDPVLGAIRFSQLYLGSIYSSNGYDWVAETYIGFPPGAGPAFHTVDGHLSSSFWLRILATA